MEADERMRKKMRKEEERQKKSREENEEKKRQKEERKKREEVKMRREAEEREKKLREEKIQCDEAVSVVKSALVGAMVLERILGLYLGWYQNVVWTV